MGVRDGWWGAGVVVAELLTEDSGGRGMERGGPMAAEPEEVGKLAVRRELGGRCCESVLAMGLQAFSRRGLSWARALLR